MSHPADGNYWYVSMAGADNFVVDDENCEKLKHAMEFRLAVVEIQSISGSVSFVNPGYVVQVDESTPAIRDACYLWNRACEEQDAGRRKRLGKFIDVD